MNGNVFQEIQQFLTLGSQNRQGNEPVMALQYFAAAGSLAREAKAPELQAEALECELQSHLDRDDLSASAAAFAELAQAAPDRVVGVLREVAGRKLLDPFLECVERDSSWLPLARAAVLAGLRSLAGPLETVPPASLPAVTTQPRAELLGPLRLTYRHQIVTADRWPDQKALRLFAWLVSQAGTPLPSARVIETLWPECSLARGRTCLRNSLYQIRFVLRDLLGLPGEGVRRCRLLDALELEVAFETDVEELELLLAGAEGLVDRQPETAHGLLSRAERLHRGAFLEWLEDAWAEPLRARLAVLRARALHLLAFLKVS